MTQQSNPYQSPAVEETKPPEGRRPAFRWRIFPAAVLAMVNLFYLVASTGYYFWYQQYQPVSEHVTAVFVAVAAALGLVSARWWWKGLWLAAILETM